MYQARKIKVLRLIISIILPLWLVAACDKKETPPAPVALTIEYPSDYYTVIAPKKTVECGAPKPQEIEARIEQKAQELARKQAKMRQQTVQAERQKESRKRQEEKDVFKEYALLRSQAVRALRQTIGADFLTAKTPEKENFGRPISKEKVLTDKTYKALNIDSGYPVDRSFILTEDRTIAAVLSDGINTQIGGTVRAYVSEDVFGADGRYKLLEKGDVILGQYEPTKKVGETRVQVSFFRILRAADGAEIYASGNAFAYAADKMGRAGLVGVVDNRNWERYGLAFSTSLIGGIAGLGKSKTNGDEYEEFFNRLSDNTTEITTKILEQYMNIAPVITIAQGEPILIRLSADLTLKQAKEKP